MQYKDMKMREKKKKVHNRGKKRERVAKMLQEEEGEQNKKEYNKRKGRTKILL